MKTALLIGVAALSLSIGQLQTKGTILPSQPAITGVQTTMAYEPGPVSISGRQFDMVTQVKVDGQDMPILHRTGNELVIQHEYVNPGFGALELVVPGTPVRGTIEFTPSLRASRSATSLDMVLNPGEPGAVWINWSLRALDTPLDIPGVFYPQMLDLGIPRSGQLCSERSLTGEALDLSIPLPVLGGISGLELRRTAYLQAFCLLGSEAYLCHSNMVVVPLGHIRAGVLQSGG